MTSSLPFCHFLSLQSVDSPQFVDFEKFPLAQQVTYRFYVGRLAVFDEDYVSCIRPRCTALASPSLPPSCGALFFYDCSRS